MLRFVAIASTTYPHRGLHQNSRCKASPCWRRVLLGSAGCAATIRSSLKGFARYAEDVPMSCSPRVPAHGTQVPVIGRERAFTMIEIIVVMVIVAMVVAVAVPTLRGTMKRTQNPQNAIGGNAIWSGIQAYRIEHRGKFPPANVVDGTDNSHGTKLVDPAGKRYIVAWPKIEDKSMSIEARTVATAGIQSAVSSFTSDSANANKVLYLVTPDQFGAQLVVAPAKPNGKAIFSAQALPTSSGKQG